MTLSEIKIQKWLWYPKLTNAYNFNNKWPGHILQTNSSILPKLKMTVISLSWPTWVRTQRWKWKFMKILKNWTRGRFQIWLDLEISVRNFEFKRKKADFTFVTSDEFRCIGLQHFDRSIITGVEPHNIIRTVRPSVKLSKV